MLTCSVGPTRCRGWSRVTLSSVSHRRGVQVRRELLMRDQFAVHRSGGGERPSNQCRKARPIVQTDRKGWQAKTSLAVPVELVGSGKSGDRRLGLTTGTLATPASLPSSPQDANARTNAATGPGRTGRLAYASRPHAQRSATALSSVGPQSLKAAQRHHIDERLPRGSGRYRVAGNPPAEAQTTGAASDRVGRPARHAPCRPAHSRSSSNGTRAVDHLADDLGAATAGKTRYRTAVARARLEELRPSVTVAPRQRTHRRRAPQTGPRRPWRRHRWVVDQGARIGSSQRAPEVPGVVAGVRHGPRCNA